MAKPIMIQGTMSNVGKSIITAGLCRALIRKGFRVAPFKSQNMALNSYITNEGLEMGRAQVVQAEACKIEPSVKMNPILLKPTTDIGSQVIVNGKSIGNMSAKDYFAMKKSLVPEIMKAYNSLAEDNDIIVIEGAGSPAEINLKSDDIVNMGMAKLVDAKVYLVGDIDRGGVFAQLYGTMELLEDEEKALVKGLIVNKFRGDKNILKSGLDDLERLTKRDIIGVMPYLSLDIDDEDSLSSKLISNNIRKDIDIAVIKLPKISNFTDFDVFSRYESVSLRYVANKEELDGSDMIIIPGTKNTIKDYKWLVESGLEAKIQQLAAKGKVIFGICGGLQMLGEKVIDLSNVEGGGTQKTMGLLPIKTKFKNEKRTTQVNGKIEGITGVFQSLNGEFYKGYEIHMGESNNDNVIIQNENIYGSYVHGIFDELSSKIILALAKNKGIEINLNHFNFEEYKQSQYEKLADSIEKNLDLDKILLDIGLK